MSDQHTGPDPANPVGTPAPPPPRADVPPPAGTSAAPPGSEAWERALITELAHNALKEQRATRRWGIAFKFALLVYLSVVLAMYAPWDWFDSDVSGPHTALVEVDGTILAGGNASADRVVGGLRAAFEHEDTKGVVLRINSPGGSPVQAGYINTEIRRLRIKHPGTPLYAVITDMAASGGYYVAASADRIYADPASLVGSIGVLMNGFGFTDAMAKLGVERRLLTAGDHKGMLDPFSPSREDEVDHINRLLEDIHGQFIDAVKTGRGDRLAADTKIFSGLIWTGEQALELGLIDAMGSASQVAREVFEAERIVDFTTRRSYLEVLAERLGVAFGETVGVAFGLGATATIR